MSTNKRKSDFDTRLETVFCLDLGKEIGILCTCCKQTFKSRRMETLQSHYNSFHITSNETNEMKREKFLQAKIDHFLPCNEMQSSSHQLSKEQRLKCKLTSYEIAALVAKSPHSLSVVNLIKDCLSVVSKNLLAESDRFLIESLPLSNDTIVKRIEDISQNIDNLLKERLKTAEEISICLDETTDCTDNAQLVTFIRAVDSDFNITEDMLSLHSLKTNTTGQAIFDKIKESIEKFGVNKKITSVTTDGGKSMVGNRIGLSKRLEEYMKEQNISINKFHCLLHQEALCAKSANIPGVMKLVVNTVNKIRSNPLHHRQFRELLDDNDSEYGEILYFTEVRWLSRANCLDRFYSLLPDIKEFYKKYFHEVEEFSDKQWVFDLAFLTDINQILNSTNLKLQGKNKLIFEMVSDINLLYHDLKSFCDISASPSNYSRFERSFKYMNDNPLHIFKNEKAIQLLTNIIKEFDDRFKEIEELKDYLNIFNNPFYAQIIPPDFRNEIENLRKNANLKALFDSHNILDFYKQLSNDFTNIKRNAMKFASYFGTTYLCEQIFSHLNHIKNKKSNRIKNSTLEARLKLTSSKNLNILDNLCEGD